MAAAKRAPVSCVTLYPLELPFRRPVSHAAGTRSSSESVVVAVELTDGTTGYGETLPRSYVTGETVDGVLGTIERVFLPSLVGWHPASFPEALEVASDLPFHDSSGTVAAAARAAVELAALDAYSRSFARPVAEVCGWYGRPRLGPPGSIERVRCSGVLTAADPRTATGRLQRMRLFGLKDFKLKVGYAGDEPVLRAVAGKLGRALRGGSGTLRVDANGAWSLSQATESLTRWSDVPIRLVEQPLARGREHELHELQRAIEVPLMLDESLVTMEDAERLVIDRTMDWMNVRLSKVGGFVPALRLADFADRHDVRVMIGCMVGESSILSAAARRLIECLPNVELVEGNFGTFLLREDVVARPLRFGFGGRLRPLPGLGWGIEVQPARLARLCSVQPHRFRL